MEHFVVQIEPSLNWFSILVLVALGIGVIVSLIGNWRKIPFIALPLILIFGFGSFSRVARQENTGENKPVAGALPSTAPVKIQDSSLAEERSTSAKDDSLDALWEKLTKSQIDLTSGSTEEDNIVLDPSDKEVTEAVAKTFGLDAEGNMPPPWVITPPKAIGNVYRKSVASDPFVTEEECRRQLESEQLPQAVSHRIEQLVSGEAGYPVTVASPLPLGIGLDYIFREICVDDFTGEVNSSVGTMKKVHVLLEFNDSVDSDLRQAWLNHEQSSRLQSFGKYALIALAALAAVYGLLRIDTWTRGYYSKQLLWGSAIAIIAVVFLLVN